ncbi:MAG: ATP-binding cassette domain-containing protein [Verrucomicrobiota bacterium]
MIRLHAVHTPRLKDIHFTLGENERVVLCGPTGAGKSTLLRVLAGLEPLTSGEVWWGDELACKAGPPLLPPHRRGIGMVFQDLGLWPHLNVRENIALGLPRHATNTRSRRDRMDAMLAECQLEDFGRRALGSLSGGELCRVALARALISEPKLLLLDEPFTGLDVLLKDSFQKLLAAVQDQRPMTVITVTHDSREALAMRPNRLWFMSGGALKQDLLLRDTLSPLSPRDPFLDRWLVDMGVLLPMDRSAEAISP